MKEGGEVLAKLSSDGASAIAGAATAAGDGSAAEPNLEAILQIPVSLKVLLGTASMPVAALVKLGRGSIVALDRKVGDPVDVTVNGRLIARGEVVVLEEDGSRFGISLTEVVGLAPEAEPPRRQSAF
jgi:flagellar motor switch protein FliN/FliY